MKISACYIAKNEEKNIKKSLDSIGDNVDEIVVLDTGSSDDTCMIVQNYPKAQLFRSVWRDDFAAARNEALRHATGDWIVFLDADESFSEETRGNLRCIIEKNGRDYDALAIKIENLDIESGAPKRIDHTYVVRAFRRTPAIRYEGRIHEHIVREDAELRLGFVPEEELLLLHTGYTPSRLKKKAQRNLQLLLQELERTEAPEKLYRYLAEAYECLDDMEKALYYARLDIKDGPRPMIFASRCYRMLLYSLSEGKERQAVLEKAVQDFPQLPEFHAEYAEYLARVMHFQEAVDEMERAFQAYAVHVEDGEAMEFDESMLAVAKERCALWKEILCREKELRISACVIARDEARDMPRWLENAARYSDERIVVDTGSTDGTAEIARQGGAAVYEYAWHDDFAAAKNAALSHAAGEWIAFLDADEYFAEPDTVRPYLAALSVSEPDVEAVMLPLANLDEDDHFREFQRFPAVRLFRRQDDIAFSGRVHEAIGKKDGSLELKIEKKHLLIYHLGYSTGRVMQKIKRNFALLQADIEENGEQPHHYRYLADCYVAFEDWQKALYYALEALESPVASLGSNSDMYRTALNCMRKSGMEPGDMLALADKAIADYPTLPDFYAEKGMILSHIGCLKEAVSMLEQAAVLSEKEEGSEWQATRTAADAPITYRRLGELYLSLGDRQKARAALEKSLRMYPFSEEALLAWQRTIPEEEHEAIRQFFSSDQGSLRFLARWAIAANEPSLAKEAMEELEKLHGIRLPEMAAAAHWQAKEWEDLATKAMSEVAVTMKALFLALLEDIAAGADVRKLEREMEPLLPKAQELLRLYAQETAIGEELCEEYKVFLAEVVQRGAEETLFRYAALASDLPMDRKAEIVAQLTAAERWQAALPLLQDVAAKDLTDASFWHDAGVCFFQTGDFGAARRAISRAREMGSAAKDIAAYETWLKEVGA